MRSPRVRYLSETAHGASMAKSYQQIQQQIAKLQREAQAVKKNETSGVIDRIKAAIQHSELTAEDLFGSKAGKSTARASGGAKTTAKKSGATGRRVPIKYRDENGNTWSARGSQPRWLVAALQAGRKIEEFEVKPH
jgi:DNA-binding protein H-NS